MLKKTFTDIVWTMMKVIEAGKANQLFGDEANGWFHITDHLGTPLLSLCTGPLTLDKTLAYRQHAEEQVRLLLLTESLTSSILEQGGSTAVAIDCHNYCFSYASGLHDCLWNEAIVVATGIRMRQFDSGVLEDERWHLKHNPHIKALLTVAHWTK